jgi:RNA polymerase sigma factor (sigma-70 family)
MEKQFDSLSEYISLAKKTISKFAPKFYNGLSIEMLKNDEAVSDVATAIMYADWRFDENRSGKTGLKKTKYSYRNQCAIWAIKTYITNKYKGKKYYSLDQSLGSDSDETGHEYAESSCKSPVEILIDEENNNIVNDSINSLLDSEILSDKQRKQIRMYYFDDLTLSEIGKNFGVSREAVRQNIKRGLDLIKEYDYCKT